MGLYFSLHTYSTLSEKPWYFHAISWELPRDVAGFEQNGKYRSATERERERDGDFIYLFDKSRRVQEQALPRVVLPAAVDVSRPAARKDGRSGGRA